MLDCCQTPPYAVSAGKGVITYFLLFLFCRVLDLYASSPYLHPMLPHMLHPPSPPLPTYRPFPIPPPNARKGQNTNTKERVSKPSRLHVAFLREKRKGMSPAGRYGVPTPAPQPAGFASFLSRSWVFWVFLVLLFFCPSSGERGRGKKTWL